MTAEPIKGVSALQRASALCDLGRWDDAAGQIRPILAADPHNTRGLCLLAQTQIGQAAHDQALRSSLAAISESPDAEWPHRLAGLALSQLGRHQEAATMGRNAVRLAPHSAKCHIMLAQVLAKTNSDLGEARAAADRAVSLAPLDADSHMAVGLVAARDARAEEAMTAYRRALALEPDNWVAHNELARLSPQTSRFDSGGLARAAGGYASAVRANPRAQVSRGNIDVVLHNFLVQTTRWIFLIAVIATQVHNLTETGLAPAFLLVLPAFFAARFAFVLAPSTRRYLLGRLRDPVLAAVVVCDALASAGLVVGAASHGSGAIAFGSAIGFGLLAWVTLTMSARHRSRLGSDVSNHGVFVRDTGVLISRSCTTGWSDWIHGELWLTETALIRGRLSLRETRAHGRRGLAATVSTPTQPIPIPGHLVRTRVTAAHRTNRYLPLTDISWAVLHHGLLNDRLHLTLDTGAKYKLLWLSADPAYDVLCEALADTLKNRFVVE
jgi:Flp pilus assembly protein TadD